MSRDQLITLPLASVCQLVATANRTGRGRRRHSADYSHDCRINCSVSRMRSLYSYQRCEHRNGSSAGHCGYLMLTFCITRPQVPLGSLYPVVLPLIAPLWANALLMALNSCVGAIFVARSLTSLLCRRPDFRRQLDSNRANGRISIHDSIRVHSYWGQRRSHTDIHQLADSTQRRSISYDIALTNSIEPSSIEGGGLEHTGSKARPVVSGDDPMSALCPEHPTGLSSKQARNSLLSQDEGQMKG